MTSKSKYIAAFIVLLCPELIYPEVIARMEIPIATPLDMPCALGGSGEVVFLTGNVHAVFSVTSDLSGGLHIQTVFNHAGVSGIGLTSGAKYQATGTNRFQSSANGIGSEFTFTGSFLLTAPGPGNNLLIKELVHMTINANGALTADIGSLTGGCI